MEPCQKGIISSPEVFPHEGLPVPVSGGKAGTKPRYIHAERGSEGGSEERIYVVLYSEHPITGFGGILFRSAS